MKELSDRREDKMKMVTEAVLSLCCLVTGVRAEDSCKVQADGKALHGAALNSFAKI
jgi:hypothetical protein